VYGVCLLLLLLSSVQIATPSFVLAATVLPVQPSTLIPTDRDGDGRYEDVNGNGREDFADVVLFFNQMSWIAANEPLAAFDFNGNNRIDFADVVMLFNEMGSAPATPTITDISPASAYRGETITAIINGTNFVSGTEVAIVGDGTTIDGTGETLLGPSRISCTLTIPSAAPVGTYTLMVRNPGASTWVTRVGGFTVLDPSAPTITGLSHATMYRGTTVGATVVGTGFARGAQVMITGGGQTIYATEESVLGPTWIVCTLTIPSTAFVGTWEIKVQNPGMTTWVSKAGALTIQDVPTPTITGFSPDPVYRGSITSSRVNVYGTNFVDGAQVVLTGGGQTVEAFGESVQNGEEIDCDVFIPTNAYLGSWDVKVQNPGMTTWVTKSKVFSIRDTPTITGISPSSAPRGSTVTATVTGTDFGPGIQVYIATSGTTVWGTDVTLLSANQFRGTFAIPSDATVGGYQVGIMIPGMSYSVGSAQGLFTVRA